MRVRPWRTAHTAASSAQDAHALHIIIHVCITEKVVTLTSQSTHHRAQHEAEKHTRAILITITKRTCTNHGILTRITPTRGSTTRTQTHTACQTEYSTSHSNMITLTRCTITTTRITRITTSVHISTINREYRREHNIR